MDGMIGLYQNDFASAHVVKPVSLPPELDGVLEVIRVMTSVKHRNKGHGNDLMGKICEDADDSGTVLMLRPEPYGIHGIKNLSDWYSKFGFQIIQQDPVIMARQPVPVPVEQPEAVNA